jgi:hypothetical protein
MNWAIKKPMEKSGIEDVKNAGCLVSTENIIAKIFLFFGQLIGHGPTINRLVKTVHVMIRVSYQKNSC